MRFKFIALLTLILTIGVFGFAPNGESGFGWDKPTDVNMPPSIQSIEALGSLVEKTGVIWGGRWNPENGLPTVLYNNGYNFEFSDSSEFVAKCFSFMADNASIFGEIQIEDIRPLKIQKKLDIWYATFSQSMDGIAVEGARADFRVKNGKLVFIKSELAADIKPLSPTISAEAAADIAKDRFNFDSYTSELVYFAPQSGELAWRIVGELSAPRHRWVCHVSAISGEIIACYDDIRLLISGKTQGKIHPMYGSETPIFGDLSYLFILAEGFLADTSELDGSYTADLPPASGWSIGGKLEGLYCKSIPIGDIPAEVYLAADSAEMDILFEPTSADLDEIDGYYHINIVHNWVKAVDPEFVGLDYQVNCYVREVESPCPNNAFWDGNSVHMGAGSGSYDNWGYYADVYYHEYGHGITHNQYPAWMLPYTGESGAIDEACSDYTASTITNEPDIGEGGLSPYGMLRSMDNDFIFPDDIENEVHADGRIIGGCFWDLRVALGRTYTDTLIHFAKYGFPEEFEPFLDEILLIDDDDGNLLNGTPNFMEIYGAFQRHGIGTFEVSIYHNPLCDTEDAIGPYIVNCIVASSLPPDPSTVMLHYSTDGGTTWLEVSMTETGIERQFEGDILGAGFESEVHYYISACDTLGICSTLPESWPLEFFGFYVGTDTIAPVIHHRPLKDAAPEAAPYEVKFVVEDNLGVDKCLVIWSFNHGSPETLVTIPDSIGECLTYLEPEFIDTGDNIEYRIEAIDGAIISNITLLPVVGNFSFSIVRSIWVDFESDDGEFISPRGWQWGIPREDVGAYSGSKCWGTMLTGDYSNNADYILKTDDFDVIGWNSGTMEMWSFWAAERPFDGGHLRISSDGGVRWYDIEPIGGYPSSMVAASGHAGFSGYSDSWEKVIFDLTPFMSGGFDLISFEFIFKSDDGANGPGWYIDDLALLEKQIVLSPGNLIAESGYNIHIPLNWASPDPSSGTTIRFRPASFDGYNIYRALSPDDFTMTPINPHPIIDTFYTDTDVANEIPYYYRVTALYHDEESLPTAIAEAMPFNAIASIEPDSVALVLTYGSEPFDTHLSIANIGSGGLEFEISEFNSEPETRECGSVSSDFGRRIMDVLRHMNEGSAFDDLIVDAMTSPSPDDWRFLLRDPDEPSTDKDIRDIWGQHDGANVWFKFDSWSYMGDPEEDFAAGFGIDIDMDPSTGSPDFMGVEYLVAVGAIPLPTPGVILKYAPSSSYGWDLAGTPHWIMANGDSAGVGFTKAQIEDPSSIYIYAAIITEFTGVPVFEDQAPNPGSSPILYLLSDAWWLDESPISSVVSSEAPQSVNLHVDVPSISIGEYRAWLGITTNDRANPSKVIPVYCRIVPVGISEIDKPLTLSLGKPFPNPFNSACRFEFSTPEGYVEIKVFDIAGRRIRELFSGDVSAGKYGTVWDGTDEAGKPLPTGVYNLSISIGESTETAKILLVK